MNEKHDPEMTETATALNTDGQMDIRPTSAGSSGPLPLLEVPIEYYVLEGEQGRGGIGIVMRARDRRTDRVVALKQLQSLAPEARMRFEREMRITARLQHPGVVPVHETGRFPSGEPFYAMKLVQGRSLKEVIADKSNLAERLALLPQVLAVAETIAYAHSQRIIHRDLKPSNVVIGAYGETVVIDWGLARDLTAGEEAAGQRGPYRASAELELTRDGQVVGTPAYMAPEQARGEVVDELADIYSLGAILYHLIVGESPYRGRSSDEVLSQLLTGAPESPALRLPDVPTDLAAIVAMAMERDRNKRYASAAVFADDIRSYLAGRLVSAHRYSTIGILQKFARRHEAAVTVALLASVVLLVGSGVAGWRLVRQRDRVTAALKEAVAARTQATTRMNDLILSEAKRASSTDGGRALKWLSQYPLDGPRWREAKALGMELVLNGLPLSISLTGDADPDSAAFSADGRWLGVGGSQSVSVYDSRSGDVVWSRSYPPREQTNMPSFSWILPLGIHGLLLTSRNGDAFFFEGIAPPKQVALGCLPTSIAMDPESQHVGILCNDGQISLLETNTLQLAHIGTHGGALSLRYATKQACFVSIGLDGYARFWSAGGAHSSSAINFGQGPLAALQVLASGDLMVVALDGHILRLIYNDTKPRQVALFPEAAIFADVSRDGRYLVVALAISEKVVIVDLDTGNQRAAGPGRIVAVNPSRHEVVIGRTNGEVAMVDLQTGRTRTIAAHQKSVNWVSYSADGRAVSVSSDGAARTWGAGMLPLDVRLDDGAHLEGLQQDPTTDHLLAMTKDGQVAVWDSHVQAWTARAKNHRGSTVARFSPDGMHIVSIGLDDGSVVVMNPQLNVERRTELGAKLNDVRFSSDSRRAVVAREDGKVTLIQLADGGCETYRISDVGVFRARWMRDNSHIIAGTDSGELIVLDMDGSIAARLKVAKDVTGLGNPRGDQVIVTSSDGTMTLVKGFKTTEVLAKCKKAIARLGEDISGEVVVSACNDDTGTAYTAPSRLQPPSGRGGITDTDVAPGGRAIAWAEGSSSRASVWWPHEHELVTVPIDDWAFDVELTNAETSLAVSSTNLNGFLLWDLLAQEKVPGEDALLFRWMAARVQNFHLPL